MRKIFIGDKKESLVESLCQKACCVERKYFMIVNQLREDLFSWYREREVKTVRINCARFFSMIEFSVYFLYKRTRPHIRYVM